MSQQPTLPAPRIDRRAALRRSAALLGGLACLPVGAAPAAAAGGAEPATPTHDMSAFPAHWHGSERISLLVYPGFTALDLVGPQYMLAGLMGAKLQLVAKTREPVRSDTGLVFVPDVSFEDSFERPDILFVPGGVQGTLDAMRDAQTVAYVRERGRAAGQQVSVCTGSLLLGMAGLIKGRRATSHWITHGVLADFGAQPVHERVVRDGTLLTGAGVSAGLDLGLALLAERRDRLYAESMQLLAEYAPEPPFQAGRPETAPPQARALMETMMRGLVAEMRSEASRTR